MDFAFILNSVLLGAGLAMDAFSVSLANGLNEPKMHKKKMILIAGMFAFFQFLMPMVGWFLVHTFVEHFVAFEKYIPWIALILLLYIGGGMLKSGIKCENEGVCSVVGFGGLVVQGIATSIDALSVGFTIATYNLSMALVSSYIIAIVTFVLCMIGVMVGKKFGTNISNKASILGGIILIFIGFEILIKGLI